jgi:hypothetical protein
MLEFTLDFVLARVALEQRFMRDWSRATCLSGTLGLMEDMMLSRLVSNYVSSSSCSVNSYYSPNLTILALFPNSSLVF